MSRRRPPGLRHPWLACLLLLIALPASVRAAQDQAGPQLVVEEVLGEVTVWIHDPASGRWAVLPLPAGIGDDDTKGIALAPGIQPPTLVSRENWPLFVFNDGEFLAVEGDRVRLQDASWHRWLGIQEGWALSGPPAGSPDLESALLQDLLNRHLRPYQIHYSVVMRPELEAPPPVAMAGGRRFWLAHGLMPAAHELTRVPMLVELGSDDAITRIALLGADPDALATDRARNLGATEVYSAVIYDVATASTATQPLFMARSGWTSLYLLEPTGQNFRLTGNTPDWPLTYFRRIAISTALAGLADLEAVGSLHASTVIAQTLRGAFRPLDHRALFDPGAEANAGSEACPQESPAWVERSSDQFSLIDSDTDAHLGDQFLYRYASVLSADYALYERLFGVSLPLPITIRIYPDNHVYQCVNPLAEKLPGSRFHGRVGNREIVLLATGLRPGREGWEDELLAALRYEMISFFVEEVTGGQAPPGLLGGVALYAQEPEAVLDSAFADEVQLDWHFLWTDPSTAAHKAVAARAMTIVAYLVDAYGWPAFRDFLQEVTTAAGYRGALTAAYGLPPSALQAEWQRYAPLYTEGRWRANIFHGFDFTEPEGLLAAGAYADAVAELKEAIAFLESIEDADNVAYAGELLARAQQGEQAGALVVQARQALQAKKYGETLTLVESALALYEELNDRRRLDELLAYRAWAEEVLALQEELRALPDDGSGNVDDPHLLRIAQRLAELGEDDGLARMEAGRREQKLQAEQDFQAYANRVLIALAVLLALRLLLALLKRAPETRLL